MITKVLIHHYAIIRNLNSIQEVEISNFDVTNLIYEDIDITQRLEYSEIFEQALSTSDFYFDNDLIQGQSFTIKQLLDDIAKQPDHFAGVSVFINNEEEPEIWMSIDFSSMSYDEDQEIISFGAVDFLAKYKELWEEKQLPNLGDPLIGITLKRTKISNVLQEIINQSPLLSGYVVKVGDLENKWIDTSVLWYLNATDKPYNIWEYLMILRRGFIAYPYIDSKKRLNFVTIADYIKDNILENSKIVNVYDSTYPSEAYNACVVGYRYNYEDDNSWHLDIQYYVGDEVVHRNQRYRCMYEHTSDMNTEPPSYVWEWLYIDYPIIDFPVNWLPGTPFAVLITKDGRAFALPYYEKATPTDWGIPTVDVEELVRTYAPKYQKSYYAKGFIDLRPEVRVPENFAQDLELEAMGIFEQIKVSDLYRLCKPLLLGKNYKEIKVVYDDISINLLDRVNYENKYYIAVEVKKNLDAETSEIIFREYYE
jgi:hypothetical protein